MSFATVTWTAKDVLEKRPDWTLEQAEEFLDENEKYIREAMTEAGFAAIDTLLPSGEVTT